MRQEKSQPRANSCIIDSHIHFGPMNNDVYSLDKVVQDLKRDGVCIGLVSSLAGGIVSQEKGNQETLAAVKKYPEFLKGVLWINPYDPKWRKDAKKYIDYHFVSIKLHPGLNNFWLDEGLLRPVFVFAEKEDLPIVIHTGVWDREKAGMISPLAQKFPRVKIVLYHMKPANEAIKVAVKYNNVYLETSSVDLKNIKKAVDECGADKVIFGSDFPVGYKGYHSMRKIKQLDYGGVIKDIRKNISQEEAGKVFCHNASKIFKICNKC